MQEPFCTVLSTEPLVVMGTTQRQNSKFLDDIVVALVTGGGEIYYISAPFFSQLDYN